MLVMLSELMSDMALVEGDKHAGSVGVGGCKLLRRLLLKCLIQIQCHCMW